MQQHRPGHMPHETAQGMEFCMVKNLALSAVATQSIPSFLSVSIRGEIICQVVMLDCKFPVDVRIDSSPL